MAALNLPHLVVPSSIDESLVQDPDIYHRAQLVARAKAQAVASKHPEAVVVAADTYIVLDNEMLEKPRDLAEARKMLRRQSGQWSEAVTGFCYLDQHQGWSQLETVVDKVMFRNLSEAEIEHYVTTQPVLEWSAAYCPAYVEGMTLISKVDGSLTSFAYGLPVDNLMECLQRSQLVVE